MTSLEHTRSHVDFYFSSSCRRPGFCHSRSCCFAHYIIQKTLDATSGPSGIDTVILVRVIARKIITNFSPCLLKIGVGSSDCFLCHYQPSSRSPIRTNATRCKYLKSHIQSSDEGNRQVSFSSHFTLELRMTHLNLALVSISRHNFRTSGWFQR
jgi:hypothetical protein